MNKRDWNEPRGDGEPQEAVDEDAGAELAEELAEESDRRSWKGEGKRDTSEDDSGPLREELDEK